MARTPTKPRCTLCRRRLPARVRYGVVLTVCGRCRAAAWNVVYDARRGVGKVPVELRRRYGLDRKGRAA